MGAQDLNKVRGMLGYRRATAGEHFVGMRGNLISLSTGEPVVTDEGGVIAALFQGPDQRTRLSGDTSNVLWLAFGAPGLDITHFRSACSIVSAALRDASSTSVEEAYG